MRRPIYRLFFLLLLGMLALSCGPSATPAPTAPAASTAAPTAPAAPTAGGGPAPTAPPGATVAPLPPAQFAAYVKEPVGVQPALVQEPIAPDLANVSSIFLFSAAQRQRLAQDGFVVSPSEEKEFYMLYEKARYNFEPILVTSDSLLHTYHLLFDKLLRTLEVEQFIPALRELNARMLANSAAQYEALRGTALEEHARRNVAFFAVGSRLLDPAVDIPAYARDLAEAELALIEAHGGILPSPLFPALTYGEDYTQYIPRGHYTRSEALKAYFKSLMWYGRMTFLLGDDPAKEENREMTRRALLITQAIAADTPAAALWQGIYEPTVFFVGRSDDLLYTEYLGVMQAVYGANPSLADFADEEKLTRFMEAGQALRPPRILGIVIGPEVEDVEDETKGFRFMGQRFIPDSYVFRQLVWRNVGECSPPARRGLPNGLDVPAALLGSERAYTLLERAGHTAFAGYPEKVAQLRGEFTSLTESDWTQNLYWSWLYMFFPLLEEPGAGYPTFMQSTAWLDKSLNTVLGSWAELRHDTILYAKQSYAEMGGGGKGPPPQPLPPKGYVEPVPEFYARLAALAAMTRRGLDERGLIGEDGASELAQVMGTLGQLETLALQFKVMAEKELVGAALTEEEYATILYYGGTLEHFTFAAADRPDEAGGIPYAEEEPQAAVVADVATDPDPECGGSPNPVVLEVGVGRIGVIYAVVPVEGQLVVAKGGVFSYYEFPWPADDRLTDEKWRTMLDDGRAPPPPAWTDSFRVDETEELALRTAVWQFNIQLIAALWDAYPDSLNWAATGEALDINRSYVQTLAERGLYEAYQLIRFDYLSFDWQDAGRAVVTTRETWSTERYQASEYWEEPGTLIARRPEHTVGVVYNLEKVGENWLVSRVEVRGQVPAWEDVGP